MIRVRNRQFGDGARRSGYRYLSVGITLPYTRALTVFERLFFQRPKLPAARFLYCEEFQEDPLQCARFDWFSVQRVPQPPPQVVYPLETAVRKAISRHKEAHKKFIADEAEKRNQELAERDLQKQAREDAQRSALRDEIGKLSKLSE